MKQYINDDWQFFPQWSDDILGDACGESVRIPHTTAVTPFNCYDESVYQMLCGYKRNVHLDDISQSTVLITFEGVAHYAAVYFNGAKAAEHHCGYTAFTVDVTRYAHQGDNVLAVQVDSREQLDQPPFGNVIDYQTYGGIYRDVYLQVKRGAYVDDVFVKALPNRPVTARISFARLQPPAEFTAAIYDGDSAIWSQRFNASEAVTEICAPQLDLKLWSVDEPNLYRFVVAVDSDQYDVCFGVRSAQFTKNGFYLNGVKTKIVGLNRHQCYPYVGYAMPESMQRRDARILKNTLCVNAVRTSHYPQSQYFIDECDKLGLLVFTEIPGWQYIGDERWRQIACDNLREMITQYRNHPSVVLWGVRINESPDCDELYAQTNAIAHALDDTRQTGGVRYLRKSHLLEDVYTFNDFNRNGATDRNKVCDKSAPYLVTEYNGHMYPTKSYDDAPHRAEHMLRYARMLDGIFAADNVCGAFGWCMFDYNTHKDFGSGDRVCYHGVTDMFRNPKWASGVFSCMGDKPYLQLCFLPDIGDYPEGVLGGVYCLTNADSIKVYKGGAYVGQYTRADSPFKHLPHPPILIDDFIGDRLQREENFRPRNAKAIKRCLADVSKYGLNGLPLKTKLRIARVMMSEHLTMNKVVQLYGKYASGWGSEANRITVEAYTNGQLTATSTIASVTEYKLDITVSHSVLHENTSYDVAAVNIIARDTNGNVCPYVSKAVQLDADGVIQIIGERTVALQGGMTGTYVKTTGVTGKGTLYVDGVPVPFTVV